MDTRIRDLDKDEWEKFKFHCVLESAKRGETVSLNTRLKELISEAVANDKDLQERMKSVSKSKKDVKKNKTVNDSKASRVLAGLFKESNK